MRVCRESLSGIQLHFFGRNTQDEGEWLSVGRDSCCFLPLDSRNDPSTLLYEAQEVAVTRVVCQSLDHISSNYLIPWVQEYRVRTCAPSHICIQFNRLYCFWTAAGFIPLRSLSLAPKRESHVWLMILLGGMA